MKTIDMRRCIRTDQDKPVDQLYFKSCNTRSESMYAFAVVAYGCPTEDIYINSYEEERISFLDK